MGTNYEVRCDTLDRSYPAGDTAAEADRLRRSFDSDPVCDGPHRVEVVVTETNDDRLDAAEEADERARDRMVDEQMDLRAEDEMADYYLNVGRTPEEEGS